MTGGNGARILFVSTQCGFLGGVERYIYDAVMALRNAGFRVDGIFCDKTRDAEFAKVFERIYERDKLDSLRDSEYDLAFIHKVKDPALVKAVRTKFKTAVMIHDHQYCPLNTSGGWLSGWLNRAGHGRLISEIRHCDAFVFTSTFMRSELLYNGFDVTKLVKIYPVCRVAPRRTRVRENGETPVIVFAGQLIKEKGVKQLLEALSMVRAEFKAYIIGSGPEEKNCKRLAKRLGLEKEVEFVGWQNDLSKYFEKADIGVLPVIWQEPFGMVGAEANSYGIPVVAFNIGGVSEWLRDERNGLLIPPKDIRAFSDALEILIEDPGYACRLGDEGRKWVETYMAPSGFVSSFKLMLDRVHSRQD